MSSFAFSKKIALRYLWTRRSEAAISIITLISVLGVAIGVMVLTIVMAVMTGFQFELRQKFLGAEAAVTVRALTGSVENWRTVQAKIIQTEGVTSASAYTYNQALVKTDDRASGLLIRGIEKGSAGDTQLQAYIKSNSKKDEGNTDFLFEPPATEVTRDDGTEDSVTLSGLIIGRELSRQLNLFPGSTVSLLSSQVSSTPFGLIPKFRRFNVVGIYKSGLIEYENGLAYMSLRDAQDFFKLGDTVAGFEVRVKDVEAAPVIAKRIVEILGGMRGGFYAQDWTETNKAFFEAMKLEQKVYFIVLLLIILMASFSIISSLIMIVIEKRKDIAIMKTLGATTASIGNIFRIQGAVIGGVGVCLGLLGGLAGCLLLKTYGFPIDERIFQMSTLPIHIDPINFLLVGVAAFAICFCATIYPAKRASRLQPSEILRYE